LLTLFPEFVQKTHAYYYITQVNFFDKIEVYESLVGGLLVCVVWVFRCSGAGRFRQEGLP
jgi:hypothetical protein